MADHSLKYYLLLILAMFFWGGSWPSAKILVTITPTPLTIGFLRFFVASMLFIPVVAYREKSIRSLFSGRNLRILLLAGLTGVFGYGVLFLTGMKFTTAAQGSIIAGMNPVTVTFFAHILHNERLTRRWQYGGFALSFAGVVFVVGVQSILDFNLEHLIGNIIILGAVMTWGLYSSISKEGMKEMSSLAVTAGGVVFGCLFFGLCAIAEEPRTFLPTMGVEFWVNILFLGGCVTFLGFFFYLDAIKNLGATQTAGFISLVPVFGTTLSVLILQDVLYWTFGLGLILVVLGIVVINFPINNVKEIKREESKTEET
ncbi:MAG: DMT family transporter [Candidatus Thorarchaeota archaeon]|nr:DMT family transporter [Candidatus Thorarchaeota archaeon]